MSAPSRRAARRELQAAKLLGTTRVHRRRFESAPDVHRVQLRCGRWLVAEVKTRSKVPALIRDATKQARGYGKPGDVAIVVVSVTGGRALAVLELRDLSALLGIALPEQPRPPAQRLANAQQMLLVEPW